mgnify:CR=1 FL=1|tara:strand:+ start:65467 stop:66579 length:1113 start_codon:yes stop_codon:yes gene_type:complete
MIVDSHAYCFPPGDSKAGYSNVRQHLNWIQSEHAKHHQPAWNIRDRSPAPSMDIGPAIPGAWSTLPDVNFRIDHSFGRVIWTLDGEEYTKQFYPPNLRNLEFTPQGLIAEMDYAGVDVALLHTNPMLCCENAFQADCIASYPNRFYSMAHIEEWRIISETEQVLQKLRVAIEVHGLHALKFNAPLSYYQSDQPWCAPAYKTFWDAVKGLNIPVFFTLGEGKRSSSPTDPLQGYMDELQVLIQWMEQYPDIVCSITHGFPWRMFIKGDYIIFPPEVWKPFENPNLSLEICFPVRIGDLIDYPYRSVWPALEQTVDEIGLDHLMWGTDMPFQNRFCTYRQSRDWIENYVDFLDHDSLAKLMGGTASRILGIS